jgi:DNA-binding CsgD family transcriptional regulator
MRDFMQGKNFLTNREREIFNLLVENMDTEEIADKLCISTKTVRNHISNVIQKLGLRSRSQALLELIKMKEIKLK